VRQFASSGFRIWNLSPEAKLVYTGFGLFALLAIAVSMLFYEDLVGPRTAGVAGYYAGAAATAPNGAAAAPGGTAAPGPAAPGSAAGGVAAGGPKIDMPDESAGADRITVAVTYRKLLEVTHFHLFTVPVFLLIIAHLFMLTGLSPTAKLVWIAMGWLSSLLHLAAPWLIRYGGAGWSFSYPLSGALMAASLSVMTVYPIVTMWRRPPKT
jgi:hypothetical protein